MRFGKISYLNLAPFDVFIKKYPTTSAFSMFLNHHKSYPSKLNNEFLYKRIDAGFISSIAGVNAKKAKSGIISYGEVWSVIAIPSSANTLDYQSASSNALSKCLGINGEILIGDRALRYKLGGGEYIDLGERWHKRYHLPFVFGLLCYNKNEAFYNKISKHFNRQRVKIPRYLLESYAKSSNIKASDIREYLKHIHYNLSSKPNLALKRFYRLARLKGIKPPRRF